MLPRVSAIIGVIAALAVAAVACKKDPTAEGAGTPVAIQAALASLNVNIGSSGTVTASVVDVRQSPLEAAIAFATCDAAIATVTADTSYHPVPVTSARAVVKSVLSGTTCAVASSGGLKPDTVVVNVVKAAPTVVTHTNLPTGETSFLSTATLNDTARVGGGYTTDGPLTGTLTFKLYDNSDADQRTCAAASPRYTQALTLCGSGPTFLFATSPGFTPDRLGTWRWQAVYGGNANNKSVTTACSGSLAEIVLVKAATTIANTVYPASGTGRITMADSAVLGGGSGTPAPKGTIAFQLFAPAQTTCGGTPHFVDSITVNAGLGKYGTDGFDADTAGTWHWVASYTGDSINHEQANPCDNSGAVTVSAATTTLSTSANPAAAVVGDTLNDRATLGGGSGPTRTITFKLFGPTDATCTGTPAFTNTVTVTANGTYSTSKGFKSTATGTWHWTATYSGDAINLPSGTACAAEPVVVSP